MTASSFRSQLVPLLLLTTIFLINFIARIILSPLMPTIEADLQISHTQAGALFFFLSAGYFCALLAAGYIASWLTHRQTILLSATGTGLILILLCLVKDYQQLCAGFTVLGLTTGLYLPSGIATLTSLIEQRHWGKGLGVHELAPNLAFVSAPVIAEGLLGWLAWQEILAVVGAVSLITGAAYGAFGKGGGFSGAAPNPQSILALLRTSRFWIMAILFGLAIGASMGVYAILPLYLVAERGMDRDWSNTVVALSRISGLGMGFVSGWATDRFKPTVIMAVVFLLTGISTVLLGLATGDAVLWFVFLQPLLAVCFFPAGFAALSAMAPAGSRNIAVSMTVPIGFLIGGGAIPTWIGWMGDRGSFAGGLTVAGGLILSGFFLSLFLKNGQTKSA